MINMSCCIHWTHRAYSTRPHDGHRRWPNTNGKHFRANTHTHTPKKAWHEDAHRSPDRKESCSISSDSVLHLLGWLWGEWRPLVLKGQERNRCMWGTSRTWRSWCPMSLWYAAASPVRWHAGTDLSAMLERWMCLHIGVAIQTYSLFITFKDPMKWNTVSFLVSADFLLKQETKTWKVSLLVGFWFTA